MLKKRDWISNAVSMVLWGMLLISVVFMKNFWIRTSCILIGILVIIAVIEFTNSILGESTPFLDACKSVKKCKDKKDKVKRCMELAIFPMCATLIITVLIRVTNVFYELIGLI